MGAIEGCREVELGQLSVNTYAGCFWTPLRPYKLDLEVLLFKLEMITMSRYTFLHPLLELTKIAILACLFHVSFLNFRVKSNNRYKGN